MRDRQLTWQWQPITHTEWADDSFVAGIAAMHKHTHTHALGKRVSSPITCIDQYCDAASVRVRVLSRPLLLLVECVSVVFPHIAPGATRNRMHARWSLLMVPCSA